MTAHSLMIAVSVGLVVGVAGRVLLCRRGRSVPLWLPVAAGVAAAVLVAVIDRTANTEQADVTALEIVLQALSSAAAVVVVAATADRPSAR